MKRVMVDNWFLKEASDPGTDGRPKNPAVYGSLLSALVLWEELCYPRNPNNAVWAGREALTDCLHPICTDSGVQYLTKELMDDYLTVSGRPDPYGMWRQDPESVVIASALTYLAISAENGCDYLPAPRRQLFLESRGSAGRVKDLLPRLRMLRKLDEALLAYYKESYEALLDFSELKLEMPVLGDYILAAAPEGVRPTEYALHLRQEGPVIRYRAYLDELEQALEEQNWKELRFLLAASQDAVKQVLELDRKGLGSVTVKLLPTPSLAMSAGSLRGELGAKPALSAELKPGRRMQLSFLRDLTRYGINNRRLYGNPWSE